MDNHVIAITGPTASGKTRRAVALASEIGAEIISCDSRQVYRGMDIGTGKDIEEYGAVPYHMIDVADAGEQYNLHRFLTDAHTAINDIRARGKRTVLCGGTGMYLESLLCGIRLPKVPENEELRKELSGKSLDELAKLLANYKDLHNTTDIDTVKRAIRAIEIEEYYLAHPDEREASRRETAKPLNYTLVCVDMPLTLRRQRIDERLKARMDAGMADEVRGLLDSGLTPEQLLYYGLEYKYVTLYVTGQLTYDEMMSQLQTAIHQFAKRQMTWIRGMQRRGLKVNYLSHELTDTEFTAKCIELAKRDHQYILNRKHTATCRPETNL